MPPRCVPTPRDMPARSDGLSSSFAACTVGGNSDSLAGVQLIDDRVQAGNTIGLEFFFILQNVQPLHFTCLGTVLEQGLYLGVGHRERRPTHLFLRVVQGNQQTFAALRQLVVYVIDIVS